MNLGSQRGAIALFARHPTAANLLMVLMLVAGVAGVLRLNTQILPSFSVDWVVVTVAWPGAAAEDVDGNIVQAIEPRVRFLDNVKRVRSTAYEGLAFLAVEFESGSDLSLGVSQVESAISQVTTLPEASERAEVRRLYPYDVVGRVVVSGDVPERFLKRYAKGMRDELLARGLDRVELFGLRDEELHVEVSPRALRQLDLSLGDIAARVRAASVDLPSGDIADGERTVRSLGLARSARELEDIEIKVLSSGRRLTLRDVATVREGFDDEQSTALRNGLRAVELRIMRSANADALSTSRVVSQYVADLTPTLPRGLTVEQYAELTDQLRSRIELLVRNGLGGLVIVLSVLFLLLSARVAFWVAVGIPVSLCATLGVMLVAGQSINMVSLFGLIMAIGIVVDDAIVVGEHVEARRAGGLDPMTAAVSGARRMAPPVFSSSLTTCAAFLPLFMIGGPMGQILTAIPLVTVAVIIASLFECFLVLPCHLAGAMRERPVTDKPPGRLKRLRVRIDAGFAAFRGGSFRRFIERCVRWRYVTVAVALFTLSLSIGTVAGKRVGFEFFPSPEQDTIEANLKMVPGTTRAETAATLAELELSLRRVAAELSPRAPLIAMSVIKVGAEVDEEAEMFGLEGSADTIGGIAVELMPSDSRAVRTQAIVDGWKAGIPALTGIDTLTIKEKTFGPRGKDIDVRLLGGDAQTLKAAATEVVGLLERLPGTRDVEDNLRYGKPEVVLEVTPRGRALGFDTREVGTQVRDALDGAIALRFARDAEEVSVRVRLDAGLEGRALLDTLFLRGPGGEEVPLTEIVTQSEARGFSRIRRGDGQREVQIRAGLDKTIADVDGTLEGLEAAGLAEIAARYGLEYQFKGKAEETQDTLDDMRFGAALGLVAIYVILAWVFGRFTRPLAVIAVVPFALVGAVIGHLVLGFDLTILSLVALIGLSGIIVNDSIVLVTTVDERMRSQPVFDAVVDGTCDRLRAVLLTSLTTIGGLAPLLFERSLQAQFLIPMATTLVFGLAVGTVIVLVLVPALLAIQSDFRRAPGADSAPSPLPA